MPEPATLMPEVGAPENVAHVIQVALTKVFLLAGISGLLNVFNARLTWIAERANRAAELLRNSTDESERARVETRLAQLARRVFALEVAIALGALRPAAPLLPCLSAPCGMRSLARHCSSSLDALLSASSWRSWGL